MGLETATYIDELDASWPLGGDDVDRGDDHIRLVKSVLQNSFGNISGAVSASDVELNILDGATVTTAELNVLDGIPAGLTATELGYVDGVTSAIQTQLDALDSKIDALFPIGYILQTTVSTNPGTHLPGTWTQIAQGRTLIGEGAGAGLTARTAGDTPGQEDAIIPAHTHTASTNSAGNHDHDGYTTAYAAGSTSNRLVAGATSQSTGNALPAEGAHTHTVTVNSATGGESVTDKNMQPSLVVYIWERTA